MTRESYRAQVQLLLERIADETSELRRLSAAGVRAAGMRDRKHALARDRAQLAELISSV
jgi:hypothetical protein